MGKFSKGRYSLMISDRSGAAFPYREMVQEWNGAWVHNSEYEPKQPQIDPRPHGADSQALQHAKTCKNRICNRRFFTKQSSYNYSSFKNFKYFISK